MTRIGFPILRLGLLSAGLSFTVASAGFSGEGKTRHVLDLNGEWEVQKVENLDAETSPEGWKAIQVPGTLRGTNYERAWYQRGFSLPEWMRGKRIKIRFDGVKFNSCVLVNGVQVGGCLNGYDPFEVDVTKVVRFDGSNTLMVHTITFFRQ